MEAWNFLRGWKPVFFISKLAQSKINPYKPEYSFCSDLNKKVKDFYTISNCNSEIVKCNSE